MQRGGDLGGGPRPLPELAHHATDGYAHRVTASGMHATSRGTVETQPSQVCSHGAVDDVGGHLVLTRNGVQRGHVDTGDLRLTHTR